MPFLLQVLQAEKKYLNHFNVLFLIIQLFLPFSVKVLFYMMIFSNYS